MADKHDAGVTPPPPVLPASPAEPPLAPAVPLAPPLVQAPSGAVAGTPPVPPYAAPVPPYAVSQPPLSVAPQQIAPYAPSAQPASGGRATVIAIIAGASVAAVAVILFIVVTVSSLVAQTGSNPEPEAVAPSEAPASPGTADSTDTEPVDDIAGAQIATELENKIAEYKLARDSGSLWESIPDTDFNRTAVTAFLYTLTDMKAATIWGIDEATAQEYASEMTRLEELLLSEQPLGMNIEIVLSDRTFRYDGDTGEGGYFDE